jgi:hypothetical protein
VLEAFTDWQIVIPAACSLASGLGASWLTYRVTKQRLAVTKGRVYRDDFAEIVNRWESDNKRLRTEQHELLTKLDSRASDLLECREVVQLLHSKLLLFESAQANFPFAAWFKDASFKMVWMNEAGEAMFMRPLGKTARDYVGKEDKEIWGEAAAAIYRESDLAALEAPRGEYSDTIEEAVDATGRVKRVRVIKWARRFAETPIGIAGIAIPESAR